jgi:hypothetical protein
MNVLNDPLPKTPAGWGWCPGCSRERRVRNKVMIVHRRWDEVAWEMILCEGSGQQPLPQDAPGDAQESAA